MKKLTILLTLIITSCAYIPVKDEGFKRDVRGEFILKTTKDTNFYLGQNFVTENINISLNPLPKLKERPKIIYLHSQAGLINAMVDVMNNYKIIGGSSAQNPMSLNKPQLAELEEAAILTGANLLLINEIGIIFISTN